MSAPRVAIACRWVEGVSGATTIILEQARRLAELGWEVHVYGERLDRAAIQRAGARPHHVLGLPWGSHVKRRLFAWFFERLVRHKGYDLVWGHGDTFHQDVLSLHNCVHAAHEAIFGAPLPPSVGVGHVHERMLRSRAFRLLIANSDMMRADVMKRFGVPAELVTTIYPGHDPRRFNPEGRGMGAAVRAQLGVRPGEVLVGVITSGDFAKRGIAHFLAALGRLSPAAREKVRAVVVGQESRLGPYERIAGDLGLGSRVSFLPPVNDVERYFHALDVYVHPALYEEFGMSVQEAMACGVCVLASKRVGAAELLRGEARETLLDKPDERGLAAGLERLILEPELRRRWAEAGPLSCRDNTWDANFKKTMAALRPLLESRTA